MIATPEPGGRMRVGCMGVGLMGHGAATNILEQGYPLMVLGNVNRAPVDDLVARSAPEVGSPAEFVRRCDVAFLCLPSTVEGEALAAATRLRVDMNILRRVASAGGANSVMLQRFLHWMIEGDDSHMPASMGIALKDLRYCRKTADEAGVGTALAEAASQTYGTAIQLGHARQFMPVLPSILATFADGKPRALPKR